MGLRILFALTNRAKVNGTSHWAKVLGVARVGVTDNYFALGGTSLSVLRLVVAMEQATGADSTGATSFVHPRSPSWLPMPGHRRRRVRRLSCRCSRKATVFRSFASMGSISTRHSLRAMARANRFLVSTNARSRLSLARPSPGAAPTFRSRDWSVPTTAQSPDFGLTGPTVWLAFPSVESWPSSLPLRFVPVVKLSTR